MKIKLRLKLKTKRNPSDKPYNTKRFTLIILALIGLIWAFGIILNFNVIVIGNDSDNNNVEINNSGRIVAPLTTDATTTIPEN